MAKKALVTGASGFLGSFMVEVLLQAGYEVRATDLPAGETDDLKRGRYPALLKSWGVQLIPSDLTKREGLEDLVRGVDLVFHVAALFSYSAPRELLFKVNVEGTRNLLDAIVRTGGVGRFVLWGAGGVYGVVPKDELPITEETPEHPPNAYLQSKYAQEQLVWDYYRREKIPFTTIRPTGVYGPRAIYGVGKLLRDLAGMKKIRCPKNFTGRVPLIHALDVCRAALYLAERPESVGQVYNLADDVPYNNFRFMELLAELLDKPFKPAPSIPVPLLRNLLILAASVEKLLCKFTKKPPKLEKDSLFLLGEDFWYSNEKLLKTGFHYAYPEGRKGLEETVLWYRNAKLI